MAASELQVWMNGEHVATWTHDRGGGDSLQYTDSWLRSRNVRPLSLSLPLPAGNGPLRGAVVRNYFDNLLPENTRTRQRVQRRFQTRSVGAYDLLNAIGRDCVGAVQLLPPGEQPVGSPSGCWLLAAIDGHAKNFSIHLLQGNRFALTPFYDVLSAWPVIGEGPDKYALQKVRLAMAVRSKNPHYNLAEIQTRHWRALADGSGVGDAFDAMVRLVRSVDEALDKVRPELPEDVWNSVSDGLRLQRERFLENL